MRSLCVLFTASLLVAACSSSDDAGPGATAPVEGAEPTEVTAAPTTAAEPPATAASEIDVAVTAAPATAPPTTETPAGDDGDDSSRTDVATGEPTDQVLLIDGPATVRPSCASLAPGVTEFTLEAGGAARDVRIFVPSVAASDPAPVVLNWHGLGSNGPEQAAYTGYEELAEAEGFIAVHATGVEVDGRNSWELSVSDTAERDDLAFADALIDEVVAEWCADPARVYSTGMSNGGLFTSELVCNRSTRFAAAASVAGTTHPPTCAPERAVPYISFHGTADFVVPFDGEDPSTLLSPEGVDALIDDSTPGEFAEFAADAGCAPEPTIVEETDEVTRFDYLGCDDGVPMAFYEIAEGGHTWPASPLADALADFGYFTQDVDATVDAWAFMSQHSL
ncbi:MAG: PHB depolymerase family esterase [Ilumatobacter sp.]